MPDVGIVLGVLIIIVFCIFAISKLTRKKSKIEKTAPQADKPLKNSGLIAAITAAVNNYRNENS